MIKVRTVLSLAVLIAAVGCGTLKHGRYQAVPVTSTPAGAEVTVHCGRRSAQTVASVTTPATVRVHRRALPCDLVFAKEGYERRTVTLTRSVSRAFWANLAWPPGLAVAGLLGGSSCEPGSFFCISAEDAAAGLFLFGLVPAAIGMAVDASTGAMYEKTPADVDVSLARDTARADSPARKRD